MGALLGLTELLRIAQQHQFRGRWSDGQGVGQRELARLVDEEDVHGVFPPVGGPEPGRAGHQVEGRETVLRPFGLGPGHFRGTRHLRHARIGTALFFGDLEAVDDRLNIILVCLTNGFEKVGDDFVAWSRDTNPLASAKE